MSYDTIYLALNAGVMPAWALLAVAPRWSVTHKLVHSFAYPIIYGGLYSAFLFSGIFLGASSPEAGMSSIGGVSALFSHPNGVLTGWTHFLVFDLFVGAWIGRDALARKIPHWLVVPSLFFSLMFGPVGLLLYALIRLVLRGFNLTLDERLQADTSKE